MKKPDAKSLDEYDFRYGSRGRHHRKVAEEGALVRLDPDVAVRFPTSEAVNAALRALLPTTPRMTDGDPSTTLLLDVGGVLNPFIPTGEALPDGFEEHRIDGIRVLLAPRHGEWLRSLMPALTARR